VAVFPIQSRQNGGSFTLKSMQDYGAESMDGDMAMNKSATNIKIYNKM